LLTEVAKQLEKFIEVRATPSTEPLAVDKICFQNKRYTVVDPGHVRYKVGLGGIELRHIHIASLEQVSRGSWQPRFIYSDQ
jgi:hypothetical protein